MNKRMLTIICAALLVFSSFVGCAKKPNNETDSTSDITSTVSSTESVPNPDDKILGIDIIEDTDDSASVDNGDKGTAESNNSTNEAGSESSDNTSLSTDSVEDDGLGDNVIDIGDLLG